MNRLKKIFSKSATAVASVAVSARASAQALAASKPASSASGGTDNIPPHVPDILPPAPTLIALLVVGAIALIALIVAWRTSLQVQELQNRMPTSNTR